MNARALLAVVISIAVVPAPARSASSAPPAALQEIAAGAPGAGICGNVVVHANAAIASLKRNDASIANALARLRGADFETFGGVRRTALVEIARAANDIPAGADRTTDETHRLRAFATNPAGDDRRAEIVAFSDALDATTSDQRAVADALAGFVSAMRGRELRESARQASAATGTDPDDPDTFHNGNHKPTALPTPATLAFHATSSTIVARTQASDLDPLLSQIVMDEARAASHSEAAVGGC